MAVTERSRDRGRRQAHFISETLGRELRDARHAAGLSQASVARASGLDQARVSRIERSAGSPARLDEIALLGAALGLRISVRAYPAGSPVRDAGQLRLLERFRARIGVAFRWRSEAPIGGYGDLRAWDVELRGSGRIGVDAETHIHDVQALQRRVETKARDSAVDRVVLVVARTRHNTAVLRDHGEALAPTFSGGTHETLEAIRSGLLPEHNGIVVL